MHLTAQPDFAFKRLNVEDGLPSSLITDIEEDKEGFIWIGTVGGIARYDGTDFDVFHSSASNPCDLVSDNVWDLAVTSDNRIVVSYASGWAIYDGTTNCFTNFPVPQQFGGDIEFTFNNVYADGDSLVWLGSSRGLICYSRLNGVYQYYPPAAQDHMPINDSAAVRFVDASPAFPYHLMLGCIGGMIRFNKKSRAFDYSIPAVTASWESVSPSCLLTNSDSVAWMGMWGNGLGKYSKFNNSWQTYHSPEGRKHIDPTRGNIPWDVVRDIAVWDADHMLVGFSSGLGVLNIHNETMHMLHSEARDATSLSSSAVHSIEVSSSGDVYVGTGDGLNLATSNSELFNRIDPFEIVPLPQKNYTSLMASESLVFYGARYPLDSTRVIFSDFEHGGVIILDLITRAYEHFPIGIQNNLPVAFTGCVLFDSSRLLLVSPYEPYLFNFKSKEYEPLPGEIAQRFRTSKMYYPHLLRLGDGSFVIWDHHTLILFNSSGETQFVEIPESKGNSIDFVQQLQNNEILVWNDNIPYQVNKINLNLTPLPIDHQPIRQAYDGVSTEDHIWVVTGNEGIYRYVFRNDSLVFDRRYTTSDGLPTNAVHRLSQDAHGNIWGGSNSGIFRIDRKTDFIRWYHRSDGLSKSYVDEPVIFLPDGSAFCDDRRYLYHFQPKSPSEFNGKCYIRSLEFPDSVYYSFDEEIEVSHRENSISASLGIVDHVYGRRDNLFYRLDGFDNEWQESGSDRVARYTNLDPGIYNLRIKAINPDGAVSSEASATFRIRPALYQRSWFTPLIVLLLISGFYTAYKYRVKSIEKAENERIAHNKKVAELELKALRAQMNPHFMFNSLNSIKNYILQSKPEMASEYLSNFAHLIRLILQNSREQTISVQDELETLLLYIDLEKLRFRNGFDFNCSIAEHIDLSRVRIPPMILQPYVENAIWHGLLHKEGERQLSIEFRSENGSLACVIDDNGIGRNKAQELRSKSATRYKSMGMGITDDRISIINELDTLGLSAEVIDKFDDANHPAGTRVIIRIPYENDIDR